MQLGLQYIHPKSCAGVRITVKNASANGLDKPVAVASASEQVDSPNVLVDVSVFLDTCV